MKQVITFPFSGGRNLGLLVRLWRDIQNRLPMVERFSKYRDPDYQGIEGYPGVRDQDSLQHVVSVEFMAHWLLLELKGDFVNLDESLVLRAINMHETGEMEKVWAACQESDVESMGDTHYIDKNDNDDLLEYELFMRRIEPFSSEVQYEMQRAFLLQFALKNPKNFPEEARRIMDSLRVSNYSECLMFQVIERWDYVMYGLEQFLDRGNGTIFVQILRNQVVHLNNYAGSIPSFRQRVWTDEFRVWCEEFLEEHEGELVEQAGT